MLELAAGTGYWTSVIADSALGVAATDFNMATLRVAADRRTWPETVTLVEADAFSLDGLGGSFDGALAAFFWSHVPISTLDHFLEVLFGRIEPGAQVVFMDNRYVEGSNHPFSRSDQEGNTFQTRLLGSGKSYEVLKNFPTSEFLQNELHPLATNVTVVEWEYYWGVTCTSGSPRLSRGAPVRRVCARSADEGSSWSVA